MAHPLVEQLRFTRGEWRRALDGVPSADGLRHLGPQRPEFVGNIDDEAPYRSRA